LIIDLSKRDGFAVSFFYYLRRKNSTKKPKIQADFIQKNCRFFIFFSLEFEWFFRYIDCSISMRVLDSQFATDNF